GPALEPHRAGPPLRVVPVEPVTRSDQDAIHCHLSWQLFLESRADSLCDPGSKKEWGVCHRYGGKPHTPGGPSSWPPTFSRHAAESAFRCSVPGSARPCPHRPCHVQGEVHGGCFLCYGDHR